MMKTSGILLGLPALLLFLSGCADQYGRYGRTTSSLPPPTANGATSSQVISTTSPSPAIPSAGVPQAVSTGDVELVDRVQNLLRTDPSVASFSRNVHVSARSGAVTLAGNVGTDEERQAVDNLVRNQNGVTAVYDQLTILPTATGRVDTPPVTTAPAQTSASSPRTGVNENYRADNQTYSGETSGAARSVNTADIFNLHVQGLNEGDRTLAQRILQGLNTDQVLNTVLPSVDIHVREGRVVLQGTVQSDHQRQTIGSVVQRAAGGINVDNQLRVPAQ